MFTGAAKSLLEFYPDVDDIDDIHDFQDSLNRSEHKVLNHQAVLALDSYRRRNPYQNAMAYYFYQQNLLRGSMSDDRSDSDLNSLLSKNMSGTNRREGKNRSTKPR